MTPFVRFAGDATLLVELEPRIDPRVNARVIEIGRAVEARRHPGVRDVVCAYRTMAVHFDPLRTDTGALYEQLVALAAVDERPDPEERSPIVVPVRYGGEDGPDLGSVADYAGCSEDEVIRRHASGRYRVYMLGFVPGFAYMGIVEQQIAAPRRSTPRVKVPAGSVGIAGRQTGIYPLDTPGGWQLIGRTTIKPFDLAREDPFLFRVG